MAQANATANAQNRPDPKEVFNRLKRHLQSHRDMESVGLLNTLGDYIQHLVGKKNKADAVIPALARRIQQHDPSFDLHAFVESLRPTAANADTEFTSSRRGRPSPKEIYDRLEARLTSRGDMEAVGLLATLEDFIKYLLGKKNKADIVIPALVGLLHNYEPNFSLKRFIEELKRRR